MCIGKIATIHLGKLNWVDVEFDLNWNIAKKNIYQAEKMNFQSTSSPNFPNIYSTAETQTYKIVYQLQL